MQLLVELTAKRQHHNGIESGISKLTGGEAIAPITGLFGLVKLPLQVVSRGRGKAVAGQVTNDLAGQHRVPPLAERPDAGSNQEGGFKQQVVAHQGSVGITNQRAEPINGRLADDGYIDDQRGFAVGTGQLSQADLTAQ